MRVDIKFEDLCFYEPKLKDLETEIKEALVNKNDIDFMWYRFFKKKMYDLVGFGAEKRSLCNTWAYEVAYQHLYKILEDKTL